MPVRAVAKPARVSSLPEPPRPAGRGPWQPAPSTQLRYRPEQMRQETASAPRYRKRIPALPWVCERSSGEVGVEAVYRPRSGRQVQALATGSASVDATVRYGAPLIPAIRAGPH